MKDCVKHALKDLNPRHQVLETYVLPTELRAPLLMRLYMDSVPFVNLKDKELTPENFVSSDI